MSRFIGLLDRQARPLDQQGFRSLLLDMLARLGAQAGTLDSQG